jgi:hypothetical protein
VLLEQRGIPTVTVITKAFQAIGRLGAHSLGAEDLQLVVIPHLPTTVGYMKEDDLREFAKAVYPYVVAGLTKSHGSIDSYVDFILPSGSSHKSIEPECEECRV